MGCTASCEYNSVDTTQPNIKGGGETLPLFLLPAFQQKYLYPDGNKSMLR